MAPAPAETIGTTPRPNKLGFEQGLEELYARWQKQFGPYPIEFDQAHPITPESLDDLLQSIEEVCTGDGSTASYTRHFFNFGKNKDGTAKSVIMMNEGNFGWGLDTGDLDITSAKVTDIRSEERFGFGRKEPFGKYTLEDTLYIDPRTDLPFVYRCMIPSRHYLRYLAAAKPANSLDVAAALEIVKKAKDSVETGGKLPVYVEIGFGMDSAAMLGDRKFGTKQYLGIDAVVGHYALEGDKPYTEALSEEAQRLSEHIGDERPGEHIQFSVADGEHLDLPNESVREVFMSNILNAPDISLDSKRRLLAETTRVLERGGRLVVRVNWHQNDWSPRMMRAFLEDSGAFVVKVAKPGSNSHALLEKQYGTQQTVQAPEGYYAVCIMP